MTLPLEPPVAPMLAKPGLTAVPDVAHGTYAFEPKWDGFRALIFRDGDHVIIQGRGGDDLAYTFPEVVQTVLAHLPRRVVLDGELVVISDDALAFEDLSSRLRPRSEAGKASIAKLAEQHPAHVVAFDVLALDDRILIDGPFEGRRDLLSQAVQPSQRLHLTPNTLDVDTARRWFADFEGAGLDGLIMKELSAPYSPGKRVLEKIKHRRTLDAVVAGWRPHAKNAEEVASLLLGLYDDSGSLQHVGAVSGFSAARRRDLAREIEPLAWRDGYGHPWLGSPEPSVRVPGTVNRWRKESAWHPLRPDAVAEVAFDAFEGDRMRHVASWERWRPDREPHSCTFDQVPRPTPLNVSTILSL